MVHASYNIHNTVGQHIHTCIVILGPLHNWLRSMVPRYWFRTTRVTADHVWGVVGGHTVFYGVIHPYQTWSMPHIKPIKQWYRIYNHPWTTISLMRNIVQALGSNTMGNSWAWLACSWKSWCGLWCDSTVSDMVHASYNTHKTVKQYVHTCVIILGPLHWWYWGFKLLVPKPWQKVEHVWGVVGGHDVVCDMMHSCQTWSLSHS